jgi:hypothetical protein
MITAVAIENFKAIRERVSFDVKPITLLFGPNSAGKSSILHALHYAREVFERRNLDADRTIAGDGVIDLGGFRNFVHGRQMSRAVVLRFDLDLASGDINLDEYPVVAFDNPAAMRPLLHEEVKSVAVEVEVAWSPWRECPYVRRYEIWINKRRLAAIVADMAQRQVVLSGLDTNHPVFQDESGGSILAQALEQYEIDIKAPVNLPLQNLADALPSWASPLSPVLVRDDSWTRNDRTGEIYFGYEPPGTGPTISLLSHLIVGPGQLLRDVLSAFTYLGPLRESLPRNYVSPRFPVSTRWANGLAAWDFLCSDEKLIREVSVWMSDPSKLATGYAIRLRQYKELPVDSPLMVLLRSDRAFDELDSLREEIDRLPTRCVLTLIEQDRSMEVQPQDVGVGITQLIPVVTLALMGPGFGAIEQPELHLHPALQVRLGELLIHVANKEGWHWHRLLVETHSEYLLLRLLRRIRETSEGELPAGHLGLKPTKVSVIYVEPPTTEGPGAEKPGIRVQHLPIDETGEFMDRWPKGFFEERAEELF